MTTEDVADRYYELMHANQRSQVVDELYGAEIINREPEHAAALGIPTLTTGLEAVKAKMAARSAQIETVHAETCSRPIVAGRYFTVALGRDLTMKGRPRMSLSELGIYEVKDGKIVSEQFFY